MEQLLQEQAVTFFNDQSRKLHAQANEIDQIRDALNTGREINVCVELDDFFGSQEGEEIKLARADVVPTVDVIVKLLKEVLGEAESSPSSIDPEDIEVYFALDADSKGVIVAPEEVPELRDVVNNTLAEWRDEKDPDDEDEQDEEKPNG